MIKTELNERSTYIYHHDVTGKKLCYLMIVIALIFQISKAFIEVPRSLNVTARQFAEFRCSHATADFIGWRVNGTSLGRLSSPDFMEIMTSDSHATLISTLTIDARLKYNETIVDCLAFVIHQPTEFSSTAALKVQGPLQAVGNLAVNVNFDRLKLLWIPPFSLDLTNINPDIIYCIQVTNATCGNGTILFSNCTIKETELNLSGYLWYYVYEFTVIPRNNVEGAMNGTPLVTEVEFMKYRVTHLNVCFEDVLFAAHAQLTMIEMTDVFFKAQPTSYSVLLVSIDGIDEETVIHMATIDEMIGNSVKLGIQPLPRRRRWNYAVIAYDCSQHPLTSTAELSTHDIQGISIYSPISGQIQVSGVLAQGATAVGILIIVYPLDHINLNVYYFEAPETIITNTITTTVAGLSVGQYGVSVFVLDENGLPFNRSASVPKRILVQNKKDLMEPATTIEYRVYTQISNSGHGVCVDCLFLVESTEYCVVIIHEKVLCFGVSQCEMNLTNIDASFKIARSGDKGHRCVQNINMTNFQVGVIGGRQVSRLVTATDSTCCTYNNVISLAVLGILIILIGGIVLILILSYWHYRKRMRSMRMPVTESQEPETEAVRYQALPIRSDIGIEDSTRTTLTVVDNSELPSYNEVTAQSDYQGGYRFETWESQYNFQASRSKQTDSQITISFTIENLIKYLLPVAGKWKELGEILFITENILDEIFTNYVTQEECLCEMLKYYLIRSDLVHDWEEISTALRKLGEEALAIEINRIQLTSDVNSHDSEPTNVVPARGCELQPHNDSELAIPMRHVMPNEETRDYPASGIAIVVGVSISDSVFHTPKTSNFVEVLGASNTELTYPIPETAQSADSTKSLCIHLERDDQKEFDQESLSESVMSHDSSSSVRVAGSGHPNENYSKKHRMGQIVKNPTESHQHPATSSLTPTCSHVYNDSEWHMQKSSLSLYQPYGIQPVRLECINDQSNACTVEPHDIRVGENQSFEQWPSTHCESETVSSTILPIDNLSVTHSHLQKLSQQSIGSSDENIVENNY